MLHQHVAKCLVGENAGEVIDAAIAFGFSNNADDLIGLEFSIDDRLLEARCIRDRLQLNFENFDSHLISRNGLCAAASQLFRLDHMPHNSSMEEISPKKRSILRIVVSCSSGE